MPKKKNNSKKRKITEIKKKKKEIKKIEESDLEKELEETEESIENKEFHEILQPIQTSAPVLTKVETIPQKPLEFNIASTPLSQTEEKENKIDYAARNEPKYSTFATEDSLDEKKYESEFRPPILREIGSSRFREEFLMPPREIGIGETDNTERIETTTPEQKRKEPFEVENKKYREVKL